MNILVVGNMGYVGPVVTQHFSQALPQANITGFDLGLFAHCLMGQGPLPESRLNRQYFGDVRTLDPSILTGVDTVINLAAISNDPMGDRFEAATLAINHAAAVDLAVKAKRAGVKSYVYASSCSVYGCAEEGA